MNSSVSSFFSRDAFLKRQPRTRKQHSNTNLYPSSSLKNKPLHIIHEEDEPRASSSFSRSPSPSYASSVSPGGSQTLGLKARRRHANVSISDIRVTKATLVHNANDISEQHPALLSAPRPAPHPPATPSPSHSPVPSPDSFNLTFTDRSFQFPHPPIPAPSSSGRVGSESPTPSMSTSDTSTSPDSQSSGLPTTPSSSDDEFPSYYSSAWPSFNARRASIKPLVITKINPPTIAEDCSISPSLRQPFKNSEEHQLLTAPSSLSSDEYSSDDESDSEWYTRELSKILTLSSPLPPSFPQQSRPESIFVPNATAPGYTKGLVPGYPTAQLDPAFPRRRRSRTSIPAYPPPPVPTTSTTSSLQTPRKSRPKSRSAALSLRRPPPRSSIPADCVFVDHDTSYYAFSDDSASAFSFSMYDTLPTPTSPQSIYSQSSPSSFPASFPSTPCSTFPESATSEEFEFDDVDIQFAMDMGVDSDNQAMMLPSLPCSPIDLEADIANGLEELRLRAPVQEDDVFTATPSTGTSAGIDEPRRALRSKWSSSTLNSIREEHSRRSASAKLRAYFSNSINSPSSKTRSSSSSRKLTTPTTPTTPLLSPSMKRSKHPRREMYTYTHTKKDLHSHPGANSKPADVVIAGQGQTQGVRRRGSVSASVSDAGSEDSVSSSGSAGLRRKPIPVEMFLRSAV